MLFHSLFHFIQMDCQQTGIWSQFRHLHQCAPQLTVNALHNNPFKLDVRRCEQVLINRQKQQANEHQATQETGKFEGIGENPACHPPDIEGGPSLFSFDSLLF